MQNDPETAELIAEARKWVVGGYADPLIQRLVDRLSALQAAEAEMREALEAGKAEFWSKAPGAAVSPPTLSGEGKIEKSSLRASEEAFSEWAALPTIGEREAYRKAYFRRAAEDVDARAEDSGDDAVNRLDGLQGAVADLLYELECVDPATEDEASARRFVVTERTRAVDFLAALTIPPLPAKKTGGEL
jgi:hypothetical protein